MKNLVYILLGIVAAAFTGCSKFDANSEIVTGTPDPTPDPEPEHNWANVIDKVLPIDDNMVARPAIHWSCTDGRRDTCYMEPWLLDINTTDLIIYRDSYQPTSKSGITPDAERSSENEVKDKLGNLVIRHHYTQAFRFNNFEHKINGSWTTGRIFYGSGKEESYLPEDGLYYNVSYEVGDTVHFVRNDSIFAREDVKIKYTATFHAEAGKTSSRYMWERTATVTVISFIGMVEHEEEIPSADIYIPGLTKGGSANRFPMGGNFWGDGILLPSTGNNYYILYATFKVDDGKETQLSLKLDSIAKSAMATPLANDPYNAVMWDPDTNRPIPCHISIDGNGFGLGARYANGQLVTKKYEYNVSVVSGIKNLSEEDNATPTPFIATKWNVLYEKDGKAIYNLEWHTNGKDGKPIHTIGTKVGDLSFKK